MTHLHLPDGVIPWPWLLLGFALTALLVVWAGRRIPAADLAARVPRVAVIAALMILGMSVPLGFIPFHMNLTVLAGILLGPWLGFVSGVAVNVILGLMGHGGLTVVGLNSLITGAEILLGALLFRALWRRFSAPAAGASATIITLVVSFFLIVSAASLASGDLHALVEAEDEHGHAAQTQAGADEHEDEGIVAFAAAVSPVFAAGVAIESVVVAAVTGYLARVRPEFLQHRQ